MIKVEGRNRRLVVNIAGNFFTRAINLASTLIIVPVSIAGLGTTKYGLLAVVLSATSFFYYADFGLGLALVNRLSISEKSEEWRNVNRVVSRIWSMLVLVALAIGVGGVFVVWGLWKFGPLIGLHVGDADVWWILVVCVAIGFPSSIAQRALFALQRNFDAGMWMSAGRVATVVGVVVAKFCHWEIGAYIFSLIGLPALVNWVSTAYVFLFLRKDLCPHIIFFKFAEIWPDMRLGLQFLILNFTIFAQTGVDNILVGWVKGANAVAGYDVMFRLFNYVPALCSIVVFPLWPALRNAISEGDSRWAMRVKKRSYQFAALWLLWLRSL